jgi:PAS domain S-box-containing protein
VTPNSPSSSAIAPAPLAGKELTREEAEAALRRLAGDLDPATPPPLLFSPPPQTSAEQSAAGDRCAAPPAVDPLVLESETFRRFLEAVPDAVVLVNRAGRIVRINEQARQLFGYEHDELLGQPIELLVPERFRDKHVADRDGYFAEPRVRPMGVNLELFGRRKDGREVPVEISLSPLLTGKDIFVVSTIRDMSARRRAEARLRRLEARYRTLVEGIPAVTFMAALDEGINELYVSPQIETLLGFSQKEWLEDPVLWHTQLHPDDRQRWHEEFARTVATGEPFRSVYRFRARDGRVVWVHGEAKVVRDDDGRSLFLQGMAFDITAIKQAEEELKALNQTLDERVKERTAVAEQRTQELTQSKAKLEVFAYTASHDLKEPLRAIRIDTQRLESSLASLKQKIRDFHHDIQAPLQTITTESGELQEWMQGQEGKIQEALAFIIESTGYMAGLLQDLDDYSQVGQEGRVVAVDCTRVFEAACNILRAAIADRGATVTAAPLPAVLGVETELVRLFQNLINNAIKFRKRDQPVQIHVGVQRQGDAWLFSVRDNGIGIKERHLERIFGIGQKSRVYPRSKYPGTGFGLAICKQIVESHGGSIWVESQFDQGSTFSFTLPGAPPY